MKTSMLRAVVIVYAILVSSLFHNERALAQDCPTPSFGPLRWFNAGTNPVFVAVGDFNGDGKLDLAVANSGSGNVSVLLGNGDGTFQAPLNFAAGKTPWSVAVGDFNGDGKLDLAVANFGNEPTVHGSVSVLLGNGDGTFQAAANYDAGTTPFAVAVGDFNRDGKLDLVVACMGSLAIYFADSTVSVLLGNGDGTFQAAAAYGPLANARSVAVGDFNGDGSPDLAVGAVGTYPNQGADGNISVLLGNGDGTFQSAVGYEYNAGGDYYRGVAVGDFNGDGKPDLAVLESRSGTVGVLLGNGDGTFQSAIHYPVGVELYASAFAIGDFNGDGKLDLAVARAWDPTGAVSVLMGNGDGTFQTAVSYGAGTNAFDPTSVAVGDFNGDGKPDLAMANSSSSGGVMVLLNTCVSAGPALAIMVSNSTLTASWPFPSTGFVLESTPSLTSPNWQPAPESAVTNGTQLVVTAVTTNGSTFFRLHKP